MVVRTSIDNSSEFNINVSDAVYPTHTFHSNDNTYKK